VEWWCDAAEAMGKTEGALAAHANAAMASSSVSSDESQSYTSAPSLELTTGRSGTAAKAAIDRLMQRAGARAHASAAVEKAVSVGLQSSELWPFASTQGVDRSQEDEGGAGPTTVSDEV